METPEREALIELREMLRDRESFSRVKALRVIDRVLPHHPACLCRPCSQRRLRKDFAS